MVLLELLAETLSLGFVEYGAHVPQIDSLGKSLTNNLLVRGDSNAELLASYEAQHVARVEFLAFEGPFSYVVNHSKRNVKAIDEHAGYNVGCKNACDEADEEVDDPVCVCLLAIQQRQ